MIKTNQNEGIMGHKTALYHCHIEENAKMVDFAGWDMPLQYNSITGEHKIVREKCGLFDVGHMGRFYVKGANAAQSIEKIVACRVADMPKGKVRYTVVCNKEGGIRDDILVTRLEEDYFFIVVNASNREKLFGWFQNYLEEGLEFRDDTLQSGMLAVQGPDALAITKQLTSDDAENLEYYHACVLGNGWILSRTGYTGEDGFEIIAPNDAMPGLWKKARELGGEPAGLGARDTLRLEVGYPLYGHELEEDISPLEAGLAWVINLDKDDFIGKDVLVKQKEAGIPRRRIGLVLQEKGVPRQGYKLFDGDTEIGFLTSGGFAPTLDKGVGMGLVKASYVKPENLAVEIRGKMIPAKKMKPPFVAKSVKE
jgi:aminomethyltransferase